jgi:hypothetical protein
MSYQDEWGHDPSVKMMRRTFARMENLQSDLLERLKLSPLDERLRRIRELARNLFEKAWPMAQRKELTHSEEDAAILYVHCFVRMLNWGKIKVPEDVFSGEKKITQFLSENFR